VRPAEQREPAERERRAGFGSEVVRDLGDDPPPQPTADADAAKLARSSP
jgi:hypothetical protein